MKILICDDHKLVRDGLRRILQQPDDDTLIMEAGDGTEAIELLKSNSFDIVLLDISLPGRSGLDVLQAIKTKWPETNVLILSMHPQEQYAIRAIKLGASGYLTKNTASEELLEAVKKVSEGGKFISQSLAERLALLLNKDTRLQKHEVLSTREFEIMIKLANGIPLQEIGNELFISVKTVSTYRSRIMAKMGLKANADLTRYCMENSLI
jgi:two-component system, NarL family, invasion response regulator UvrY